MKRILVIFLSALYLCGCNQLSDTTQPGLELRQRILGGNGCKFNCVVYADFGNLEYNFTLDCTTDNNGDLSFVVLQPENISQIAGSINDQTGNLTFDDTILSFPHLAEGEISPVCAPWLFYKALLGGYIRSGGKDEAGYRLTVDDSFKGENLVLEVWLSDKGIPTAAEIVWQGRRLLVLKINEFLYI